MQATGALAVHTVEMDEWMEAMTDAGEILSTQLDQPPADPPPGRARHKYGDGPFAVLLMPPLPDHPGLYVWFADDEPVYVGQTRVSLRKRLGANGYARISPYNTLARQPGRTNGGQQTNCRVNALANEALRNGLRLSLLYTVTEAAGAGAAERDWMRIHGRPPWNLQNRN